MSRADPPEASLPGVWTAASSQGRPSVCVCVCVCVCVPTSVCDEDTGHIGLSVVQSLSPV